MLYGDSVHTFDPALQQGLQNMSIYGRIELLRSIIVVSADGAYLHRTCAK